jgi:hypothetical protein
MSNEDTRTELHDELLRLSEDAMSAQWYGDLEFILWDRLGRGTSRLGGITLTEDLLEKLSRLSQSAGGWFYYSDDAEQETIDGLVFIDLNTWDKMYAEWLSRVPAPSRPRDR